MTASSTNSKAWQQDPLYYEGLNASQLGHWNEAEQAYTRLLEQYSGDAEAATAIGQLLEQVRLRLSLDQAQGAKVQRARRRLPLRRISLWAALAACLVVLGYLIWANASASSQPAPVATPDANATVTAERGNLLQQAQAQLAAGQYTQAIATLQDLLARFPYDEEIKALLKKANERWQLAVTYQQATSLIAKQDWAGAIPLLEDIERRQPGYRDVDSLLAQARQSVTAESSWQQAEAAFSAGDWATAAQRFEAIAQAYPDYRKADLAERLYHCYFSLGVTSIEGAKGDPAAVRAGMDWFAKALVQRPGDSKAAAERRLAQLFLAANDAANAKHLDEEIGYLQALYDARFNYMDGTVAPMLYDAYMARAAAFEAAGKPMEAINDYAAAERLTGPDVSAASAKRLELTLALTPTPTPTAPPTPTPFQWSPALIPTPTPEPTPQPLATYKGQIAFWTDREGVAQLYLMNPDGSNQRPAPLARWGRTEYDELRAREAISPDGRWQLYTAAGNNRVAQIWVMDTTKAAANRQVTRLDNICYDPVWSPDGYTIAFVSEQTGVDDIWTATVDGKQVRDLTKGTWEWHKHPSWSPDGSKIVYWSNAVSGHQQIWIMNPDGTGQTILSNNDYNDWDPIWIK